MRHIGLDLIAGVAPEFGPTNVIPPADSTYFIPVSPAWKTAYFLPELVCVNHPILDGTVRTDLLKPFVDVLSSLREEVRLKFEFNSAQFTPVSSKNINR